MRWCEHITRSIGLAKMIVQDKIPGVGRKGRQKKRWGGNISEWTDLGLDEALRKAKD